MPSTDLELESVLVVDDERKSRDQAVRALAEGGFQISAADSGKAALRLLESRSPAVVVLHVDLPDVSAFELLQTIVGKKPDTPVIVTARQVRLEDVRRAMREGAFDFRQWPLTDEELRVACRHAVELLRLRLENRNLHKTTPADRRTTRHEKTERSAMERAAFARLTAYIGQVVAKASTRVLEKALGEPESGVAVTDVMTEALLADEEQGEWAAALLRGAHTQRELLKQAGGTLSASEVGTFLGISRAAVDKRRRQGALLGLRLPSGDFAYPAVQFSRNDVLPGLRDVLGAFKIHDPWMQLDILLSSDPALQGRSGFQALAEGDSEEVEARVANVGEQGL